MIYFTIFKSIIRYEYFRDNTLRETITVCNLLIIFIYICCLMKSSNAWKDFRSITLYIHWLLLFFIVNICIIVWSKGCFKPIKSMMFVLSISYWISKPNSNSVLLNYDYPNISITNINSIVPKLKKDKKNNDKNWVRMCLW